ncbi:MAG: Fic family protein [bacterium]|nr:Fic family protein [bacterium]
MSANYNPKWKYDNLIVDYLMKIHAAVKSVELLSLPLNIEDKLKRENIFRRVHYSTKIEGNQLSLDEVCDVIDNGGSKRAGKKDVNEVRNYYNALLFLDKKAAKQAAVTRDFIRELHAVIDANPTGRRAEKTPYRDGQNVIRDSSGGGIVYMPPEAADVPELMSALVNWIEKKENVSFPIPIVAAVASYQLLTIHPFRDGNGRTARALATYILKRGNYDLKGFYSMEEFYDKDIQRYYGSLQMGLHHNYYFGRNNADITPWITYFLEVMADVFDRVNRRVNSLYYETVDMPDLFEVLDKRERWVANFILRKGVIGSADVAGHFNIDRKTAMNWLKAWEENRFLKRKKNSSKRYIEFLLDDRFMK